MATGVRDKYNVAINGKGYMLRGTPNTPGYRRDEVPTAISRLALSDLQYSDFSGSGTFFTAQSDWSAGIKSDKTWKDDAKYYYSTNIDAYSEPGAFKLQKQLSTFNDFSAAVGGIYSAAEITVGGVTKKYFGTDDDSGGYVKIYDDSISDIASTTFPTGQNIVSDMTGHKDKLWAHTVGSTGGANVVKVWDGSSWTDKTSGLNTANGGTNVTSSRVSCELAGSLYVQTDAASVSKQWIQHTDDAGSTWTLDVNLNTAGKIVDMIGFAGRLYYLLVIGSTIELRQFDPDSNLDISIGTFYGASTSFLYGLSKRMLHILNSKLVITIPPKEVYEFDGDTLTRIFQMDDAKIAIGASASVKLTYGGIQTDNRILWGNLIYDGTSFFNSRKDSSDSTTEYFIPMMANSSNQIYGFSTGNRAIVLTDSSNYKETLAKNYLVFSEMSPVVSIDKLLSLITVVFDPLAANQSIAAEYSTDGGSTWVALETMTSTTEGTTATKRDFIIPNSVSYNKIFIRVKLAGTSTTTPVVRDVIVGYKPIPNYKNRWQLRLEMSDGVKLLNRQPEQRTGSDLLGGLWNEKATKQTVNYEDIDYVECSLVSGMTAAQSSALINKAIGFPRRGRIRAVSGGVSEEMTYTSAESNKIFGISRGQRGTRARAYSAGQVLDNAYTVYIERLESDINWTDEVKSESIASVTLVEK